MGTKSDNSRKGVVLKKPGNHWSENLLNSLKNPDLIIHEDEIAVAIKDLYPKATYHYLVCPKEDIPTLKRVTKQQLSILQHMHHVGIKLSEKHKDKNFLLGYHMVPSMVRLHLHVISDDFDSPCLKTKKHWNSFTTDFFVPSEKVIEQLETTGKILHMSLKDSKNCLNQPLKCYYCSYTPKHMPDLKQHIKSHQS